MKILKTIIYHLFLSMRGLFFFVFNFIAGLLALCIFGFLLAHFMSDNGIGFLQASGMSCVLFIIIYFIKHFYDKIIFWSKPNDDTDLTLFK